MLLLSRCRHAAAADACSRWMMLAITHRRFKGKIELSLEIHSRSLAHTEKINFQFRRTQRDTAAAAAAKLLEIGPESVAVQLERNSRQSERASRNIVWHCMRQQQQLLWPAYGRESLLASDTLNPFCNLITGLPNTAREKKKFLQVCTSRAQDAAAAAVLLMRFNYYNLISFTVDF
jgi:hypothetical protein